MDAAAGRRRVERAKGPRADEHRDRFTFPAPNLRGGKDPELFVQCPRSPRQRAGAHDRFEQMVLRLAMIPSRGQEMSQCLGPADDP
jgi:hypothetical protein